MRDTQRIIQSSLEILIFIMIIAISFIFYVLYSPLAGIIAIAVFLVGVFILIIFKTPGRIIQIKYPQLIRVLKKSTIVREPDILEKLKWPEEKLHHAFYDLSKAWLFSPMVLFVKPYYIFINISQVERLYTLLLKNEKLLEENPRALVKVLIEKYKFQTRAEAEIVIERLKDLRKIEMKNTKT